VTVFSRSVERSVSAQVWFSGFSNKNRGALDRGYRLALKGLCADAAEIGKVQRHLGLVFARATATVPGQFARAGPVLVHFARAAPLLGHFARPLLGHCARAGLLHVAHFA
jgi:hypothetical protein